MFQALHDRLHKNDERGFTLIELMVVVLIIAILIAIAIPTFLGARTRAQDRAAQTDLRNSLVAAEVWYTDNENYSTTATDLEALEPELDFNGAATSSDTVGVIYVVPAAESIVFVRQSASGTYFGLAKQAATGTTYCSGDTEAAVDTTGECTDDSW